MEQSTDGHTAGNIYSRNRVIVGSLIWMTFGIIYMFEAIKQGLFLKGVPGPGFLPFLCSVALAVCAAVVIAIDIYRRLHVTKQAKSQEVFDKPAVIRILVAFATLFGFSFMLDYIGFTIGTFVFILATLRIMEPKSWRFTVLVSLAVTIVTYVVFVLLLEVSLPKSLLGFI